MRVIHKEFIAVTAKQQNFKVPVGTKILKFDLQQGVPVIWLEKPIKYEYERTMALQLFGTGHPEIPNNAQYINSVQMGEYVWHLYEV